MQNNSERERSHSFLSHILKSDDKLFLIIILTLIIIILLILYLIEKIIFIILTFITFTSIIAFPLQVFLHLLLIRYIILEIAFSGQICSYQGQYFIITAKFMRVIYIIHLYH